jgi:hypothetical protein
VNGPDSTTSVETLPLSAATIGAGSAPCQREDAPGDRHRDEQDAVAAAASDAIAVAGEPRGGERIAGEQRREDGADGGVRVAAIGEGDADEHRAQPVGERARHLRGDDPACVGAQPRSS